MIEIGRCYKIAGRRPIVIIECDYRYGLIRERISEKRTGLGLTGYRSRMGERITVTGFTPRRYEQYKKFYQVADDGTYRTVAEVEGITRPPITRFSFRPTSKVVEVQL